MTDPDTYIESRRNAILEYIRDYKLKMKDINCSTHTIRRIKLRDQITMKTIDEVYESLVKITGERKSVEGDQFNIWMQHIAWEFEDAQEEYNLKDADVCRIISMDQYKYSKMKKNIGKSRGRLIYHKLQVLLNKEDLKEKKYKPKYTSILSYWRINKQQ